MRLFIISALFALAAVPALAQSQALNTKAQLAAWDRCVGENAQDYADMFGAVSMDGDKLDKAVEDCWDEEYKYEETIKQNPSLSDGAMDELVAARKAEIRSKWFDAYVKNRKDITQASTK